MLQNNIVNLKPSAHHLVDVDIFGLDLPEHIAQTAEYAGHFIHIQLQNFSIKMATSW